MSKMSISFCRRSLSIILVLLLILLSEFCVSASQDVQYLETSPYTLHNHQQHSHEIFFASGHSIDTMSVSATSAHQALMSGASIESVGPVSISHQALFAARSIQAEENSATLLLLQLEAFCDEKCRTAVAEAMDVKLDHYLPHHTYLITVKDVSTPLALSSFVRQASILRGVRWLGRHRAEYKLTANLGEERLHNAKSGPEIDHTDILMAGGAASIPYEWQSHQGLAAHLAVAPTKTDSSKLLDRMLSELRQAVPSAKIWSAHWADSAHCVFIVPFRADLLSVARHLTSFASVRWVELHSPMTLRNKWARGLMQTGTVPTYQASVSTSTPFSTATNILNPLTGANEVVGVVDSGIDMLNCFFFDPDYAAAQGASAPFYPLPAVGSDTAAPTTADLSHRKVVQYITGADNKDDSKVGHGTHVSGSLAGNIQQLSAATVATDLFEFDGMAYNAKLAFFDSGNAAGGLMIPPMGSVLQWAYTAGARIHSDSWGSTAIDNTYSVRAVQFDTALWLQRDMLVLAAAGNEGNSGFSTVSAPATAKNVIAVGASMNDYASLLESSCGVNGGAGYLPAEAGFSGCSSPDASYSNYFSKNNMPSFSSMGPTSDGRMKPDLVAIGTSVMSALSGGYNSNAHCPASRYDNATHSMQGTSMSTPILAGSAALLRQYFREGWFVNGAKNVASGFLPSAALLKAVLINSGTALTGKQDIGCCAFVDGFKPFFVSPFPDPALGKCCCTNSSCSEQYTVDTLPNRPRTLPQILPNKIQGFGRPTLNKVIKLDNTNTNFNLLLLLRDAASLIAFNDTAATPQIVPQMANLGDSALGTGMFHETAICVTRVDMLATNPLKITLVYTDYPGSIGAWVTLVNDLNLVVIQGRDQTGYLGNGAVVSDNLNNVEQVQIPSADTLLLVPYVIRVVALNVPQGPQPYALVASGPVSLATVVATATYKCGNGPEYFVSPTFTLATPAPTTAVPKTPSPTLPPAPQASVAVSGAQLSFALSILVTIAALWIM